MKYLELLIPPPVIMLIIGLMIWLSATLLPEASLSLPNGTVIAALLALAGLAISSAGVITFQRANTTLNPKQPATASRLVDSGIYRYSRNPMYLGVLLMLMGWGVYLGNMLSILFLALYIAYITRFQIIPEERLLQEKFPAEFRGYKQKVRRWL